MGLEFHSYRGALFNGKLATIFLVGSPKLRVVAPKFGIGLSLEKGGTEVWNRGPKFRN